MDRSEPTIKAIKKTEAQENYETIRSIENPEELRQRLTSEAKKETDQFKKECANDLSRFKARAQKDELTIDSEACEQLRGLEIEADKAKAELTSEVSASKDKSSESNNEKANIIEVVKDKNFEGSIIIKTIDEQGWAVGYAIRRNYSGDLEGNKIGYMHDGSIGPVYQLHEADFAKLDKNGVLKAYSDSLVSEGRSGFRSEKEKFSPDFSVENKEQNIEEITEDPNFKGSVVIKTKDDEGKNVAYAIRRNSAGEFEGNEIRYIRGGEVGPVYQLHEADFAKLAKNGVLAAYEDASALKNGNPEGKNESGEKGGQEQESKYQKWLEASRSEEHRKRGEKIIEFKRKLVENKKELSRIQRRIFEEIERNPDYSVEQYFNSVKTLLVYGSLSNEQQLAIRKGIDAYVRQHEAIQDTIADCVDEKNGNVDGGKLYEKLFNRKPHGRVEPIIGSAIIYLRLEDLDDYTIGYYGGTINSINEEMSKRADGTAGCKLNNFHIKGLENAIALEKATKGSFDNKSAYSEATFRHENQHIVNSLLNKAYNAEQAKAEKNSNKNNKDINIEKRTKDEISAYFKDGRSPKDLRKILLDSDPNSYEYRFDYADGDRKEKRLSQKYIDLVENGIIAYQDMLKEGYGTEEIQAILFNEALSKWPRVVERFTGRKKSIEEIKNVKDELLDADELFEKMKSDPERYSEIIKAKVIKTANMLELHNFLKPALFSKSIFDFGDLRGVEIGNVFSDMISYIKDGNKKILENIPNVFGLKDKAAEFRKNLEMKNRGKNPMSRLWEKIAKKDYDIDEIMSS